MKNRKKNRKTDFDYSNDALYFVSICIKDRLPYFGEIIDGQMIYTEFGEVAVNQWNWLQEQYPYIVLHTFIVMPNHVHAIIEINSSKISSPSQNQGVSIKIKSLSELIGAYKTTTSKKIHLLGLNEFAWQRSFHDHIIRNTEAYENIKNYIEKNPKNWTEDMFYIS